MESILIKTTDITVDNLLVILNSYKVTDLEIQKKYIHELSETENRIFFLLLDDLQPVGYVQLILKNADNDPELANGTTTAHIHDLRIHFEKQGQGFGQKLILHLESKAKKLGFSTLTLGVDDCNKRAIKFYNQLGYKHFKTTDGRTEKEFCLFLKKEI